MNIILICIIASLILGRILKSFMKIQTSKVSKSVVDNIPHYNYQPKLFNRESD